MVSNGSDEGFFYDCSVHGVKGQVTIVNPTKGSTYKNQCESGTSMSLLWSLAQSKLIAGPINFLNDSLCAHRS